MSRNCLIVFISMIAVAVEARILPETLVVCQCQFYPLREQQRGYLGRYVDQPLFLDPDLPLDGAIADKSYLKTWNSFYGMADLETAQRLAKDYGLDGFSFFCLNWRDYMWTAIERSTVGDFLMIPNIQLNHTPIDAYSLTSFEKTLKSTRGYSFGGKKLIVFCSLHDVVDQLTRVFPHSVTVTGRDSAISKQAAVDSFQNSESCNLIICSIKAAGVGLTLTASSNVAFIELAWTYADCCQCEDRAHRIGQKDNVTCYYLLGRGTIDHTIYSLIHKKKSIAAEIMNSDDEIPQDAMYFDQLVQSFLDGGQQDGDMQDRPDTHHQVH